MQSLDPERDLVLTRTADVPPSFVWECWTRPDLLVRWFCPAPWQTVEAEIDLRPGGVFRTVMRAPDGRTWSNVGCYLAIVPGERLVWTGALGPGFRPHDAGPEVPFVMTAIIDIAPHGAGGCAYTATVLHADAASRARHEAMGFRPGWNAAFDQLLAMAPTGR